MDNPAKPDDLAAIGYAVSPSPVVETRRLNQAWRALVAEIPSIPARLEAGILDAELVVDVVVEAAHRVLRNPGGFERYEGRLDDYSEGGTLADPTTDIYFKAAELRRLALPEYGAGSMSFHR